MASTWTIEIDNREKKPLPFPKVIDLWDPRTRPPRASLMRAAIQTQSVTLETADYRLAAFPQLCVIERKGHLQELYSNLVPRKGRTLFIDELKRLRDQCRYPYVLLEGTPHGLMTDNRRTSPHYDPNLVRDLLLEATLLHGVQILILPSSTPSQRRALAEWVAALLIRPAILPAGDAGTLLGATGAPARDPLLPA